jgi:hypothetical protein
MTQRWRACPSSAVAKKFHLIGLLCTYKVHAQMDTMNLAPVVHRPLNCFHQKILLVVASCFEYCLDRSVQDDVELHAQCTAARYLSAHIRYCIVAASSHSASRFANHSAFYFVTLLAVHDLHIVHAQLFVKYATTVGVGVAIFHLQVHAQLVAVKN